MNVPNYPSFKYTDIISLGSSTPVPVSSPSTEEKGKTTKQLIRDLHDFRHYVMDYAH